MISHRVVMVGVIVTLGARLSASPAPLPLGLQSTQQGVQGASSSYAYGAFPEVWEILAHHGALEVAHQMARKSARSPSRRLRFGRRTDPMMPPEAPIQEARDLEELQEELFPGRQIRAPVRMRFGRRSVETAVPHILPMNDQSDDNAILRKDIRAPSMRLRFGRRSDLYMLPYEHAERDYRTNQDTSEADAEE